MQDDDDDRRQRENLIAAGFVIVLVVFSIWLLHKYQQYRAMSDCVLSGRHNCATDDGQ
jgi:heme/copper-type cytochrome/quinol oxidase subunit 4